jgi:hypothetical protein
MGGFNNGKHGIKHGADSKGRSADCELHFHHDDIRREYIEAKSHGANSGARCSEQRPNPKLVDREQV